MVILCICACVHVPWWKSAFSVHHEGPRIELRLSGLVVSAFARLTTSPTPNYFVKRFIFIYVYEYIHVCVGVCECLWKTEKGTGFTGARDTHSCGCWKWVRGIKLLSTATAVTGPNPQAISLALTPSKPSKTRASSYPALWLLQFLRGKNPRFQQTHPSGQIRMTSVPLDTAKWYLLTHNISYEGNF